MKFIKNSLASFLYLILSSSLALSSHHHDSESNKPSGDGHCLYMADNPFAGDAYKACRTNVSEGFCDVFSEVGDGVVSIVDPQYGFGDCPRDSSIGSCERGGWEEVYYEDSNQGPMGVKFGCNFAGDWIKPQ